ncbi:flavodoxin domain-containing protein [Cardiosporidium cionae]|uniref:Flavodoxin domain-containing protein n=1 Tax=Cardiosporidium cionae TaxID=476202 RepID=A0ABQ7JAV7_9APIC|nr:flavodoxin domain-containing protein [Cardiosporidium cionae]|eukprot:KAF8821054.1 flavodoxin domain-containing protein [Cardiosporidium cionae]
MADNEASNTDLPLRMAAMPSMELLIAYGSQTGTAEAAAWDVHREVSSRENITSYVIEGNAVRFDCLSYHKNIDIYIFIIATTGQGDFPETFQSSWEFLLKKNLRNTYLSPFRFTVFGLGDSRYAEFNSAARKFRSRLLQLGGEEIYRIGLGDDRHDFGYETEFDPWIMGFCEHLFPSYPYKQTMESSREMHLPSPKYSVNVLYPSLGFPSQFSSYLEKYSKNNSPKRIYPATNEILPTFKVLTNKRLSDPSHFQNIRSLHLESPSYATGDVCCLYPVVDKTVVSSFLETLQLDPHIIVCIYETKNSSYISLPADKSKYLSPLPLWGFPTTLEMLFSHYFDITAKPTRYFFYYLSLFAREVIHQEKLQLFSQRTIEGKEEFYMYCRDERRSYAEIFWDFGSAKPPLEHLLSMLPLMKSRKYSISNSPAWNFSAAFWNPLYLESFLFFFSLPSYIKFCLWTTKTFTNPTKILSLLQKLQRLLLSPLASKCSPHVELCVALVEYKTKLQRPIRGTCSAFIDSLLEGDSLHLYIERGFHPLPSSYVDPTRWESLLMICPGTGVAPCRSIIQSRHLYCMSNGRIEEGE